MVDFSMGAITRLPGLNEFVPVTVTVTVPDSDRRVTHWRQAQTRRSPESHWHRSRDVIVIH